MSLDARDWLGTIPQKQDSLYRSEETNRGCLVLSNQENNSPKSSRYSFIFSSTNEKGSRFLILWKQYVPCSP